MGRRKKLPKVLNDDEKFRLLDQFNTRYRTPHRNRVMILTMLKAGLRVSEVVSLKDEHLDLENGRLIVRNGKGGVDRTLWISEKVCQEIQEWLDRRGDSESGFVFNTTEDTAVKTSYMRAMVSRMAKKAKIAEAEKVSPHTMRHSAACDMLQKTGNVYIVQRMLGHAHLSTTEKYLQLADNDLKNAMKGL